jgi:K(+)-stimulated pyrophosphate-energized sodium pump
MIGLFFGLGASLIAIITVLFLIKTVLSKETGTEVMKRISRQIQLGAAAFLKREYTYIAVVVVVIATVMLLARKYFGYESAISFVWGAIISSSAG